VRRRPDDTTAQGALGGIVGGFNAWVSDEGPQAGLAGLSDEPTQIELRCLASYVHEFYTHAYDYQVEWKKLQPLVDDIADVLGRLKTQIDVFLTEQ
jgi:hypothetical protein